MRAPPDCPREERSSGRGSKPRFSTGTTASAARGARRGDERLHLHTVPALLRARASPDPALVPSLRSQGSVRRLPRGLRRGPTAAGRAGPACADRGRGPRRALVDGDRAGRTSGRPGRGHRDGPLQRARCAPLARCRRLHRPNRPFERLLLRQGLRRRARAGRRDRKQRRRDRSRPCRAGRLAGRDRRAGPILRSCRGICSASCRCSYSALR